MPYVQEEGQGIISYKIVDDLRQLDNLYTNINRLSRDEDIEYFVRAMVSKGLQLNAYLSDELVDDIKALRILLEDDESDIYDVYEYALEIYEAMMIELKPLLVELKEKWRGGEV